MDDDVGETGHGPLVGAGHGTDMPYLWKFADPLGLGENARRDASNYTLKCNFRETS